MIFRIFRHDDYLFPEYPPRFMPPLGCGGAALFAAGIVIATACACKAELVHMRAVLDAAESAARRLPRTAGSAEPGIDGRYGSACHFSIK